MIVVDSAAVVDALAGVPDADELRVRLADEDLHAPGLLDADVVSAVRGLVLGGHLTTARAWDLLDDFDALPVQRWSFAHALRHRAFELRDRVTAYDAAYVVLAESLECPLVTRDGRLARAGGHDARVELW